MDLPVATRTLKRTAESAMVYRCTIQRIQPGGEDSWGGTGEPNWQPHLTDVPCYVRTDAAKEPVADKTTVAIIDRRVLIPRGFDVTEADRVGDIDDRDGTPVLKGPMGVEGVVRRHTHTELLVEVVR